MGQFSWFTQDTNRQIYNDWDIYPNDKQTVYMIDPRDGHLYKEEAYEGYGVFGGRDFYELLTDINKNIIEKYCKSIVDGCIWYNEIMSTPWQNLSKDFLRQKRGWGIDLWFKYVEPDSYSREFTKPLPEGDKVLSPILVEDAKLWKNYAGQYPESDPNQGWHCQKDDSDDEEPDEW